MNKTLHTDIQSLLHLTSAGMTATVIRSCAQGSATRQEVVLTSHRASALTMSLTCTSSSQHHASADSGMYLRCVAVQLLPHRMCVMSQAFRLTDCQQ